MKKQPPKLKVFFIKKRIEALTCDEALKNERRAHITDVWTEDAAAASAIGFRVKTQRDEWYS
jgi:hypothetical protein